jgi:hypothetical protein
MEHSRLPAYLHSRLPKDKGNLQLGQHWVWDSFSKKLVQLAAMMILSKHVRSLEGLKNYRFGECILEDISFFSLVTGDLADLDGSYGVADGGRQFLMIRFGAAEVGMSNRWRGHEKASKLETAQDRKSRFYTRYPHKDFVVRNDPSHLRIGLFQNLQQFVGIGFKRDNKENIVNLFDWDKGEVQELEKLTAASESRNTLVDKKYRHIVYLSELLYAVSLDLKDNISSNPGCEWQLKYFGK